MPLVWISTFLTNSVCPYLYYIFLCRRGRLQASFTCVPVRAGLNGRSMIPLCIESSLYSVSCLLACWLAPFVPLALFACWPARFCVLWRCFARLCFLLLGLALLELCLVLHCSALFCSVLPRFALRCIVLFRKRLCSAS